jgi:hypothetical protein
MIASEAIIVTIARLMRQRTRHTTSTVQDDAEEMAEGCLGAGHFMFRVIYESLNL